MIRCRILEMFVNGEQLMDHGKRENEVPNFPTKMEADLGET